MLPRRKEAGQRVPALDDLEQRLLLTEQVLVRTFDDDHLEVGGSPDSLNSTAARRSAPISVTNDRFVATNTSAAPTTDAAMAAPSMTRYGSRRINIRSLNVAGSPSAPLATT